jgi:hypothetical protein
MPDSLGKASEFGGKIMRNRVQPLPHVPTQSERLMLLYTTGDSSGTSMPDNGETFAGLLPYENQLALREAEGVMRKGEEWERMQTEAAAEIVEIALPEEVQ